MLTPLAPANGDIILPLAAARAHLNYAADETAYDAGIIGIRDDAIGLIEEHASQSLQARPFRWDIDSFTSSMRLPIRPSQSVNAITYRNSDGQNVPLIATDWLFSGGFLSPAAGLRWPLSGIGRGVVRITFTAGYASAGEIPLPLMRAVKLAMAAMDDDRANPDFSVALRMANRFRRRTL